MVDALNRNLPDETFARLSRLAHVTMDDLRRSAELAKGVLDDDVMRGAWSRATPPSPSHTHSGGDTHG